MTVIARKKSKQKQLFEIMTFPAVVTCHHFQALY